MSPDSFFGRYVAAMRSRQPSKGMDVTPTKGGLSFRSAVWAPSLQDQFESLLDAVWVAERWERRHPFTAAVQREVRL